MFDDILQILNSFAERAEEIVKENWRRLGKNATGQTISTLRNAVSFNGSSAAEIDVIGSKVFQYSNDGRPAGSRMPPQGVLLDWMQARGIPADKEFVIRRSIGQKGIEPSRIIDISLLQINNEFNSDVAPRILQELGGIIFQAAQSGFELNITN